jgi:hypothetical protein
MIIDERLKMSLSDCVAGEEKGARCFVKPEAI